MQGRVSKVNLYQKDKDLEEILLLYCVQGKPFKIVHDQMTQSMNTETWQNGTVSEFLACVLYYSCRML